MTDKPKPMTPTQKRIQLDDKNNVWGLLQLATDAIAASDSLEWTLTFGAEVSKDAISRVRQELRNAGWRTDVSRPNIATGLRKMTGWY